MRRIIAVFAAAMLAAGGLPAAAQERIPSTAQFLDECSYDPEWCAYSVAEVIFLDSLGSETAPSKACVPGAVADEIAADAVVAYLRDHPEIRHSDCYDSIVVALAALWPCAR